MINIIANNRKNKHVGKILVYCSFILLLIPFSQCTIIASGEKWLYIASAQPGSKCELQKSKSIELEATYDLTELGYPFTPVVGDIDLDGHPEIVFGTDHGNLVAARKYANNTMELVWAVNLDPDPADEYECAVFSPALGNMDPDSEPEIVVYTYAGPRTPDMPYSQEQCVVYVLNANGLTLWAQELEGAPARDNSTRHLWNDHAPALGDFNLDGYPDIAIYLGDGNLYVLNGLNGTTLLRAYGGGNTTYLAGKTAILDLDLDGAVEVISAGGELVVYRNNGSVWWKGYGHDFAVTDLDLDGTPELIVVYQGALYSGVGAYTYYGAPYLIDGTNAWGIILNVSCAGPTCANFDLDIYPEVAIGTTEGHVIMIDDNGTIKWDNSMLGIAHWGTPDLASADMDLDGIYELVVTTTDRGGIVLDGMTGTIKWNLDTYIYRNEGSGVIADVDNDAHFELVSAGGYYETPVGTMPPYEHQLLIIGNDDEWAGYRTVWNQLSYYTTNVRDDLTITDEYTPWRWHNTWRAQALNVPPVAYAGPDRTIFTDYGLVQFDGSESFDIDGTIVNYYWDFGDNTTGSGVYPVHIYEQTGNYTVNLTVEDDDGAKAWDTAKIHVAIVPHLEPTKSASPSEIYLEGCGELPQEARVTLDINAVGEWPNFPQDTIFLIDTSGSMAWNDPENHRIDAAKNYVLTCLKPTHPGNRGAVIDFDDDAEFVNGHLLTNDFDQLLDDLDELDEYLPSGGTNFEAPISLALTTLTNWTSAYQIMIMISDGKPVGDTNVTLGTINKAIAQHVRIFTIALNSPPDGIACMRWIAKKTNAKFFDTVDPANLDAIYQAIGAALVDNFAALRPEQAHMVRDVLPSYIHYVPGSFSIKPDLISYLPDGSTVLEWDIARLNIGENWSVSYNITSAKAGYIPITVDESMNPTNYSRLLYVAWNYSEVLKPINNFYILVKLPTVPPPVIPVLPPPPPPPSMPPGLPSGVVTQLPISTPVSMATPVQTPLPTMVPTPLGTPTPTGVPSFTGQPTFVPSAVGSPSIVPWQGIFAPFATLALVSMLRRYAPTLRRMIRVVA